MSHKRQHLSSQSMQPLLRPGQYGQKVYASQLSVWSVPSKPNLGRVVSRC